MEEYVSLDELYTIKDIMERISGRLLDLDRLQRGMRAMEPELALYPKQLDMRRLPPPWSGHGWSIVITIWLLAMEILHMGLFGGLLLLLFNYLRIKKERGFLAQLVFIGLSILPALFVVSTIFLNPPIIEGGMTIPFLLFLGAYLLTGVLMSGPKKRANQQIEAENQARYERNEAASQRNESLRKKCVQLEQQVRQLQNELGGAVEDFGYPPSYVSLDAVNFFIHCLENHWAKTYGDMIDKYRTELHRRDQEEADRQRNEILQQQADNQERMREQLAYNNMLQNLQIASLNRNIAAQGDKVVDAIKQAHPRHFPR